ncbi:uncharacterized protein LOC129404978 [Sorex araneus]|uniref:uncharacterized protein LOC129404978 n=1 Tax=Sorex araneus TaxID=42254 RepID=UPI002433D661|nr:uncharacterized protein LOC129404978 [Sorex araneus]
MESSGFSAEPTNPTCHLCICAVIGVLPNSLHLHQRPEGRKEAAVVAPASRSSVKVRARVGLQEQLVSGSLGQVETQRGSASLLQAGASWAAALRAGRLRARLPQPCQVPVPASGSAEPRLLAHTSSSPQETTKVQISPTPTAWKLAWYKYKSCEFFLEGGGGANPGALRGILPGWRTHNTVPGVNWIQPYARASSAVLEFEPGSATDKKRALTPEPFLQAQHAGFACTHSGTFQRHPCWSTEERTWLTLQRGCRQEALVREPWCHCQSRDGPAVPRAGGLITLGRK